MNRLWPAIFVCLLVPVAGSAQVPPGGTPAPATPGPPSLGPSSKDLFDAIHVVVGPSGRSLDPIAIAKLQCPAGQAACAEIDKTLDKDLTISGYFKVLDRASFLADPAKESLAAVSWADWANVGAKYLVKTEVKAGAKGLDLEFRLMNVIDRKSVPVKGQSHSGVAPGEVRGAVHAFVNGVIEAVTGKPGIFGTSIVMSVKTGAWERAIVAMDVGGTGRRTLVSNGTSNMFPHWAPGGDVLYTSFLPNIPSLYVGGRRITNDGREYRGASFAPGGGRIAASVDMGGQSDIVLVDPKSGAILKNLTNSSWDEVTPSWSPDGSQIAYVSNRTGSPQIEVMGSGGGGGRRLTMAGSYNTAPDFGPNGLIVFCGMDGFQNDIFTVDLSGNLTRLTQDQGSNKDPTWSPDGRYVAFLSNREGGWKVWIMTDDGRYQFPISDSAGGYATPDWGR